MGNRTKTKSTSTVRNGRFNLSFGISIGPIARAITNAIKRSAAPTGLVLLTFATACAPVTRTVHVATVSPDRPASTVQNAFVVNVDQEISASSSELNSKLETLFEGQRLAVEMVDITVESELGQITFNLDAGSAAAMSEMPTEVLASVASELGIMSERADEGLLLASAANLIDGPEPGNRSPSLDSSVSGASFISTVSGGPTANIAPALQVESGAALTAITAPIAQVTVFSSPGDPVSQQFYGTGSTQTDDSSSELNSGDLDSNGSASNNDDADLSTDSEGTSESANFNLAVTGDDSDDSVNNESETPVAEVTVVEVPVTEESAVEEPVVTDEPVVKVNGNGNGNKKVKDEPTVTDEPVVTDENDQGDDEQ